MEIEVELDDTPTARALSEALPLEGEARLWGDEIYFSVPIHADLEPEAREAVEVGNVGFWPPGNALCLFFGPTPASHGDEPRAASEVNVLGRVAGDAEECRKVKPGETLRVERGIENAGLR